MKLSTAFEGFEHTKLAEGLSPNTLANYRRDMTHLAEYLGDPEVEKITTADLRRFLLYLRVEYQPKRRDGDTSPLKPVSIAAAWVAFRSFFNWAETELGIVRPDGDIKRPAFPTVEVIPFTEDELRKLLKACNTTAPAKTEKRESFIMMRPTAGRDKAIILVLLDTGLRASECARLLIGDVDISTGELQVRPIHSGKKSKSRVVYMGKGTKAALWKYLAGREDTDPMDPLFLGSNDLAMDRHNIARIVRNVGKRAGVKKVHPHRFRHTFAIQFLRNGGDIFSLQRLLGHSSLEIVRHYLALAEEDAKNAHHRASPVDRWGLKAR